jgi:hypothetical protein
MYGTRRRAWSEKEDQLLLARKALPVHTMLTRVHIFVRSARMAERWDRAKEARRLVA